MKFSKYFMMAGLAALMAACSSEEPIDKGASNGNENSDVQSYLNLSIKLPSETATRADSSNDQFDDGTPEEYAVKSGHLVVFESNSDNNDAKVVGRYELDTKDLENALKDHRTYVTGYFNLITAINNQPSDNLYVLVVLNMTKEEVAKLCPDNKAMSALVDTPMSEIAPSRFLDTSKGFVMMNAPVYDSSIAKKTSTFQHITKEQMFRTPELAQMDPNATLDVFVERVMAKASLKVSAKEADKQLTIGTTQLTVGDVAWNLDVTNNKTFAVRNVTSFDKWPDPSKTAANARFFSNASNRIYWAVDPNYSAFEATDFSRIKMENVTKTTSDVAYCLENTFDVANQRQDRTTRMILKAKMKIDGADAKSFYTIANVAGIYKSDADLQAKVKEIITNNGMELKDGEYSVKLDKSVDENNIIVDLKNIKKIAGANTFEVGDIKYKVTEGDKVVEHAADQAFINELNNRLVSVNYYKNGECYYIVRLKHFGDKYCPWDAAQDPTYDEVAKPAVAAEKWLGRYGMVRNNWYEVDVNKFTYLGLPNIPDPSDDPDDVNVSYINYRININAWAKRVQNVTL